ncbi:Cobalt transport protein CbiN [Candidatus Defluviicoccus seviourii]|uniref:Cobalt transport protein CbiN n=1 Tax=Candidatus Defluviicoccus seviourii TaxID=2565273 RepID=A0A564WAD4_9PROT|nr:Cobalt transport protein CbiN [Candidatus Defluviicoccus seviourii]
MARRNAVLLLIAAALAIVPLLMGFQGEEVFGGADGAAQTLITEIQPAYEPWFGPLWEPPSGEVASLLFTLQAALGAGFLGYYLGLRRGQVRVRGSGGDGSH